MGNIRYQDTVNVMLLLGHACARSKHTENFRENSQMLTAAQWQK